jgi:hypothetical protein
MDKFLIVSVATFGAGARLGLSKEQAAARAGALTDVGKGVYVAKQSVQFKAGEVIGIDGDLPKALAVAVDRPVKAKKAAVSATPATSDPTPSPEAG